MKANFGCGKNRLPGYENYDIADGFDARKPDLPNGAYEEVRASHLLEHFTPEDAIAALRTWVDLLAPGGVLKISVPDFDKIVECYNSAESSKFPVEKVLMGGHVDSNDAHKAIYNRQKLEALLRAVGMTRVESWVGDMDTSAHPVSLNLKGVKPTPRAKPPAVFFVLSCPRLGFTDMFMSVIEALKAIPNSTMRKVSGAFWGQCLERGMSDVLTAGADYVIALDYDTVLAASDVQELLYLAESYPEADALIPLQSARGWSSPLVSIADENGKLRGKFDPKEFADPITKCNTGHFGATLFRAESLRKFPHPWFVGQPNAGGEWRNGKVDDDIYFWMKWKNMGFNSYLANRVVIGHCEIMVKWPSKDWQTVHQSLANYNEKGKPEEAWQ